MKRKVSLPPIDQATFATLTMWGMVPAGTALNDTNGNGYRVGRQDEAGFLALWCLTSGRFDPDDKDARAKDKAFESMDGIDHAEFQVG
jgi:hypothetical protein